MTAVVWLVLIGLIVAHVRRRQIRAWWRRVTSRMLSGAWALIGLQALMLWAASATDVELSAAALFVVPVGTLAALQVTR